MRTQSRKFAKRLRHYTEESNALHAQYLSDPELEQNYAYYLDWQVAYNLPFYAEFQEDPETTDAVDFMITDLLGTGVSSRDADFARVIPIMTRLLPAGALKALASAMELNARVIATNLNICHRLFAETDRGEGISERDYCAAFRASTSLDECLELIDLTVNLGHALKGLVHNRLLGATLRSMHRPAHAAGFGAMQDFLEKGYAVFHQIDDVDSFLDRFGERMIEVFTRTCEEPLGNLDSESRGMTSRRD